MSASVSDVAYDGLDLDAGSLLRELSLEPQTGPSPEPEWPVSRDQQHPKSWPSKNSTSNRQVPKIRNVCRSNKPKPSLKARPHQLPVVLHRQAKAKLRI